MNIMVKQLEVVIVILDSISSSWARFCGLIRLILAPEPSRLDDEPPRLLTGGVSLCKLYMTYEVFETSRRRTSWCHSRHSQKCLHDNDSCEERRSSWMDDQETQGERDGGTVSSLYFSSAYRGSSTYESSSLSEIIQILILLVHVSALVIPAKSMANSRPPLTIFVMLK